MAKSYESDANDSNMVKQADSGSSTETNPSNTYLGRRPIPMTSSCYGLLGMIEMFRKDVPYVAAIIRRSAVEFTSEQVGLVHNVLEGARLEQEFGCDQKFIEALTVLEESLDDRIEEETDFFNHQKTLYASIYEALVQSSFPYSMNQARCLHRFRGALYEATGNPTSEADQVIGTSLKELVRLMQLDDHLNDTTPHRFIVKNTIPYYLQDMVKKLDILAKEEGKRDNPSFVHPLVTIDWAIYLVVNLEALIVLDKVLTPREHFHVGMVEVYTKLVEIFKKSALELSIRQETALKGIERQVRSLRRNPVMSKHASIGKACIEFMSELEEASPDCEVTLDKDGKVIRAVEGTVNKAVRDISWDLVYLRPAASSHLANFPSFGNGVEDITTQVMERFLAIYPMH